MSKPRPADGTLSNTLHWLCRPTGEPHWMVATWNGEGWNMLNGRIVRPDDPYLVWWNYSRPAAPPNSTDADHRKAAMIEMRAEIQKALDEHMHDFGWCDAETGTWEACDDLVQERMETLDDVLGMIDRRIAKEFGGAIETTTRETV